MCSKKPLAHLPSPLMPNNYQRKLSHLTKKDEISSLKVARGYNKGLKNISCFSLSESVRALRIISYRRSKSALPHILSSIKKRSNKLQAVRSILSIHDAVSKSSEGIR